MREENGKQVWESVSELPRGSYQRRLHMKQAKAVRKAREASRLDPRRLFAKRKTKGAKRDG